MTAGDADDAMQTEAAPMSAAQSFASTVSRLQIVDAARGWLGTPYVHQASAKGAGCDCLGLVRGLWRELYGREAETPPPYTPDWTERRAAGDEPLLNAAGRHLIAREDASAFEPGDVLVFRVAPGGPAKHCGIASAPAQFIHAYAGRAVVESWLTRWWRTRLAGVFIFPGAE
ncbi:MAG: NlpC/P60 family protein [Pseudomonadota bacterium]